MNKHSALSFRPQGEICRRPNFTEGQLFLSMKFYTYITISPNKDALYVGMTNNLEQRIIEHFLERGKPETHAGKYYCYNLVFYEEYKYVNAAIRKRKRNKKMEKGKERSSYLFY